MEEFSSKFDCYHTGPTAEELVDVYIQVYAHFASHPDITRWSTVSIQFRDHGYRQTAGGFHKFYLNNPPIDNQLAHFFPVPPADILEDWRKKKMLCNCQPKGNVILWLNPMAHPTPIMLVRGQDTSHSSAAAAS